MNETQERILQLKREKDAVILAHFYQTMDIQEIADYVGDSFELAKRARDAEAERIVFCGVKFMAESAKLLNPQRMVLMPVLEAGCPMADMIAPENVLDLRKKHPEAAVMCYVNSSAAVKAVSDICCTSSSALKIARSLEAEEIIFIPDRNLGDYVARQVPEKKFIFYEGYCPVHDAVRAADVLFAKERWPEAEVLAHPECRREVLELSDFIGSTKAILEHVEKAEGGAFIISTELGVLERLKVTAPGRRVYPITPRFVCPNMKKTALSDVLLALEKDRYVIDMAPEEMEAARRPLERMVAVQ